MAIVEAISIPIGVTGTESVESAANSYEDLGDAVAKTQREAERLALQYGINDARTQEAITAAAQYKYQLEQLDTAIDLNTSSMELLVSVSQTLVGAFSAAIGATALFGSGSEDLTRILTKVQGALALSEGLNNLQKKLPESVVGLRNKFTKLNKTLRTTSGILKGLSIAGLIAGLVLFIKYLDPIINKLKEWSDALGITNFALEAQIKFQEGVNKNVEREIALLEAQGATQDVILKKRIDAAKEAKRLADLELKLAKFRKDGVEEAEQAQLDAINNVKIAEANLTQYTKIQIEERLKAQQEFNQQMFDLQWQEYLDNKQRLQDINDLERLYQAESRNDIVKNRLLREIELEKQFKEEREMLENALDMGLITQEKYDELNLKQNDNHKKKLLEADREYAQAKRDLEEKSATEVSQMLLDLNNVFQGQRENQNKQEFEREKALSIAQTLISTYFAAQRAYASQLTATPDSPIRAAIAAAAAITSGLSRVASIRRTQYNDTNANATSSGANGGGQAVPRFNAPSTRLPGGGDEFTQVRRVYVTETDITNVQEKVKVTEKLSQF
jgi:hypothetical protein